jgi:hypothetical protein
MFFVDLDTEAVNCARTGVQQTQHSVQFDSTKNYLTTLLGLRYRQSEHPHRARETDTSV